MDSDTTIEDLKIRARDFCRERDWEQYHNPKDLAIGISSEAGELLEIFRFQNNEQCQTIINDPQKGGNVRDELADVLYFTLRFAEVCGIDLSEAFESKLRQNREKYPVEKFKGVNRKYNE